MRKTDITLNDLKQVITGMCPIRIFINNILVWDDDDVDLTNMHSYQEALDAIAKNEKKFENIFLDPRYVLNINFEIVEHHHSIVRVATLQ